MARYSIDGQILTNIANAINEKTGETAAMTPGEMVERIAGIGGGVTIEPLSVTENGTYTAQSGNAYSPVNVEVQPNLQSKTISPTISQQTVVPDEGYDGLSSVVVSPITPTKAAQTYTPGTTNQTIPAGRWLTGLQTIKGDANLVASNIKSGVSIFGVMGNYVGGLEFYKDTLSAYNGTMYFVVGNYEDGNGEYACDFFLDSGDDVANSEIFGSWKKVFGGNGVEYKSSKMKVIGMFTDGIID